MSKLSIIDQILDAIDNGKAITIDWENLANEDEKKKIKALLSVHKVSRMFKQKQSQGIENQIQTGQRWMHLVIKEKIGTGGFGQVFRAYDSVLETDVAVKFLNVENAVLDEKAFLREARLMATVRNPHVLAIHGAATDLGVSGYWSDYLDGEILYELIKNKPSKKIKYRIIKELTKAVKATHDNEVVHGDIKSLNVMFQENRGAILLDFGSSRSGHTGDKEKQLTQASPIAMAPEQYAGNPGSFASDVYALGLLFYEIHCDHSIFEKLDIEFFKQHPESVYPVISDARIPKLWKKCIISMLNPVPDLRPGIDVIYSTITTIEQKPLERAKTTALALFLLMMVTVTTLSLYSQWSIRKANQEAVAINQILKKTFLTVSPYRDGRQVRLLDALLMAEDKVKESSALPDDTKQGLLTEILITSLAMNDEDVIPVISLAEYILEMKPLTQLSEMTARRVLGIYYSQQKRFDLAEPELLAVTMISAETVQEYDQLMGARILLAKNALEQSEFELYLQRKAEVDALKDKTSMSSDIKAQMIMLEADFFSVTGQRKQAQNAFDQAASHFVDYYHEDHAVVLSALARLHQNKF